MNSKPAFLVTNTLHFSQCVCLERNALCATKPFVCGDDHLGLGVLNGQRHVPSLNSGCSVAALLRECLAGSRTVAMVAHVSPAPSKHSETLHTAQLASRVHRMRRRKAGSLAGQGRSGGSGGGSGGSSDEMKHKRLLKLRREGSSDPSSSAEFCSLSDTSLEEDSSVVCWSEWLCPDLDVVAPRGCGTVGALALAWSFCRAAASLSAAARVEYSSMATSHGSAAMVKKIE